LIYTVQNRHTLNHIKYYLLSSGPTHYHGFISDYLFVELIKVALLKGISLPLLGILGIAILKELPLLVACGVKLIVATLYDLVLNN
jgi:hypothetical protein